MEAGRTPEGTVETGAPQYERCEECGAPMDPQQRYCVHCAARRKGAESPAERYFAAAARLSRRTPVVPRRSTGSSGVRAAAVGFFALLPIAVALGVLVGRSGTDNNGGANEAALLKAIKQQDATAASGASTATASVQRLSSDFGLAKGFTVKLSTLPVDGTDQTAASKAEKSAEAKGAKDVGIIDPSELSVKPSQGAQSYVLYSGEFKQRGQAEAALKKLKPKFKSAEVIEVTSGGASAGGKVVAKTQFGTVHKVAGLKTSDTQAAQGAQLAQQAATATGKDYVNQEKNLPDVIPVGPSTGSAGAGAPKGAGD
jgi:hypothetical protein